MPKSLYRRKPYLNPEGIKLCRLKKGDRVQVMEGKFNKKIGLLKLIRTKEAQVIIEGINMVNRNVKGSSQDKHPGERRQIEAPIAISNVALVCPKCVLPTRVAYTFIAPQDSDGKARKVRVCKRCKAHIDD
jgi:large subunit ribosomal protein L24